jgi:hypothetical protein
VFTVVKLFMCSPSIAEVCDLTACGRSTGETKLWQASLIEETPKGGRPKGLLHPLGKP